MADTTRDIELRIRARDLSTAELKQVSASVRDLNGALEAQLQAAQRLDVKEKELRATLQQFSDAAKNVSGLDAIIQRVKLLSDQITNNKTEIDRARVSLDAHRAAMAAGSATGKAAEQSLAGFERALKAAEQALKTNQNSFDRHNESLRKAGIETQDLVNAERELVQLADMIGNARTRLTQTITNYARVEREAKEAAKATAQAQREAAEAAKAEAAAIEQVNAARRTEAQNLRSMLSDRMRENRERVKQQEAAHLEWQNRLDEFNKENRRKEIADNLTEFNRKYDERKAFEANVQRIVADQRERDRQRVRQQAEAERIEIRERGRAMIREQEENDKSFLRRYLDRRRETRAKEEAESRLRPVDPNAPRTDAMGRPGRGASANPTGFLGLRPYELTNLGYQVNDVFSGLASGQNATQILAQQGGQFIQIFGTAALRWFPLVAAAAAAVTVAIQTLTAQLRTAASNREFAALLQVNKQAADLNAESLTRLRKELYFLGVSWEDAGKSIRQAVSANVRPEFMRDVLMAARDMARVQGVEMPQAMADLVKGIGGSVKAFDDLAARYPVLTDRQADYIRGLLLNGRTSEAQVQILRILGEEYRKAADLHMSPMQKATEDLGKAWKTLIDRLAESKPFEFLITKLTEFVGWLTRAVEATDRLLEKMKDPRFAEGVLKSSGVIPPAGGSLTSGISSGVASWVARQLETTPVATASIGGVPITTPSATSADAARSRGAGLDQSFHDSLQAMIADAASKGISLGIGSGFRTSERQAQLFAEAVAKYGSEAAARRYVAPPGNSLHERGMAVDLRTGSGTTVRAGSPEDRYLAENAARFGLTRPMAHEAWHVEPAGARSSRGVTGATPGDVDRAKEMVRLQEEEARIRNASSEKREAELIREKALREVRETIKEIGTEEEQATARRLQNEYAQNKVNEYLEGRRVVTLQREGEERRQQIQDGKDFNAIQEGGLKAREEAVRRGITNHEQLYSIQQTGESETRAAIQRRRQEEDSLASFKKQLSSDERAINLKNASDLEQALEAVNIKYRQRLEALDKITERSTTLDKAATDEARRRIEALKAQETAEARIDSARKAANEALTTRSESIRTINRLEELGEITLSEKENLIKKAYDDTRQSVLSAADALEKTIDPATMSESKIALLTARVKELRAETKYVDPFFKGLKDTFSQSFSTGLDTAFSKVAEAIGGAIAKTKEWKDVFVSVKDAALNLFAQLLKDLASYIIKAQAAKLASSLFGGTSFGNFLGIGGSTASSATSAAGAATTAASSTSSGLFGLGFLGLKTGGVAGRTPPTGISDPSWWAGAPRYRTGTIVGLAPDEQRAILHRGEEVLSADNPRNILNGGGKRGDIMVRNVLVDDRRRIAEALQGAEGERVIVQHILKNGATIREVARG